MEVWSCLPPPASQFYVINTFIHVWNEVQRTTPQLQSMRWAAHGNSHGSRVIPMGMAVNILFSLEWNDILGMERYANVTVPDFVVDVFRIIELFWTACCFCRVTEVVSTQTYSELLSDLENNFCIVRELFTLCVLTYFWLEFSSPAVYVVFVALTSN